MKKLGMLAALVALQGLVGCGGGDGEATASQDESGLVGQRCGTIAGIRCASGEYCDIGVGQCEVSDAAGVCRKLPRVCPLTEAFVPVCGCDGKTYSSACAAAMAGVSVDHVGACTPPEKRCGGIVGRPCDAGQYCEYPIGQCQVLDGFGVCRDIPQACLDVVKPVCGCDGKTYGNACEAASASMSLDHTGSCIHIQ